MQFRPSQEAFKITDFRAEDFPVPYDKEYFPRGFHFMEIVYDESTGIPEKICLYGSYGRDEKYMNLGIETFDKPSDIEKILRAIQIQEEVQGAEVTAMRQK